MTEFKEGNKIKFIGDNDFDRKFLSVNNEDCYEIDLVTKYAIYFMNDNNMRMCLPKEQEYALYVLVKGE